ncbi:MAG: heterodisulfide reductase-related iron-sulfur binding cluster [Deltaproteobacteria bacterium]|nr:heterodisulfide reductase-related iron-sulfur binding cluster [Deltaproteobacteria bacterium]
MMYLLFFLSIAYFVYAVWKRFKALKFEFKLVNLKEFLATIFFQKKLITKEITGWAHFFIYFGFLILVVATTSVFIDYDLGLKIYRGNYYLAITFLSDLAGLLIILCCCAFLAKRYIDRSESLISSRGDLVLTLGLILLCVQGFVLEGLRIVMTNDPWRYFSFVGHIFAVFFEGFSLNSLASFHFVNWWIHTITVFVFFALLPYTKSFHIVTSPLNLLLKNDSYAVKYPNLLQKFESGEVSKIGYEFVNDLNFKNRLDLEACTSCGRCQEVCPAFATEKPLSPKWLILHQRRALYENSEKSRGICGRLDDTLTRMLTLQYEPQPTRNENLNKSLLRNNGVKLVGGIFDANLYWSCTTCNACVEVCPVGINHLEHIMEARRFSVIMEGMGPIEALSALRTLQETAKPLNVVKSKDEFFRQLDVRILRAGDKVECLLWVGCISVGDKRKELILSSLVKILRAAGVDFGVLGDKECCTGDPARRLGDEATAQSLSQTTRGLLKDVTFEYIVSHCPHCVNAFIRDYPEEDASFVATVYHHSEFIQTLLLNGKLNLSRQGKKLTIHDPCYLTRYLRKGEEARRVLSVIGDVHETRRNLRNTFCCGAGGGQYFYDLKIGKRMNSERAEELLSVGVEEIVTMCPFCNQMISDGVYLNNSDLPVKDIAEVIADSLV